MLGVEISGGQLGREVTPRHVLGDHLPGEDYLKL